MKYKGRSSIGSFLKVVEGNVCVRRGRGGGARPVPQSQTEFAMLDKRQATYFEI